MDFFNQLFHQLTEFINTHIELAPFIICGALLLAGLNVPVSEDGMIFIAAILSAKSPEYATRLFAGLFAGAYLSDLISYGLGRVLGPRLWRIKFFSKMVSVETVDKIGDFYNRYGPLTLIAGRFIPFGVRNGLFITAGLSKMNFVRFAVSDFIAAIISVSLYFYLYFTYGKKMIAIVKQWNVYIFIAAVIIVCVIAITKKLKKKKT